eukprot:5954480-Amphidinium_carterae.1
MGVIGFGAGFCGRRCRPWLGLARPCCGADMCLAVWVVGGQVMLHGSGIWRLGCAGLVPSALVLRGPDHTCNSCS